MKLSPKAPAKIPATVMSIPHLPPYSIDGKISPSIAAASITPAAKASTISENLCEIFLKANPMSEPNTVAPPTPRDVSKTSSINITPFTFLLYIIFKFSSSVVKKC